MAKISLAELRRMADEARDSIWAQAKGLDREPKIYLHWTAGHYGQMYTDEYHIGIDEDGSIYNEYPLDEVLSHTWKRNTGAVGISLACAVGATTDDLGYEPPTDAQIEAMAQVIWIIADALWLSIDKKHVLTHGECADNEDGEDIHEAYGPKSTVERWDLEFLGTEESPEYNPWAEDGTRGGDVLRGKANWYRKTYGNAMEVADL